MWRSETENNRAETIRSRAARAAGHRTGRESEQSKNLEVLLGEPVPADSEAEVADLQSAAKPPGRAAKPCLIFEVEGPLQR